jgi:DNA (cytosine-5)-methyltransferase 1
MWPVAEAVFKANFPQANFYGGRIEQHDPDSIAKELGKIDLIMASPECTNHSVAKGNKPRCEKSRETAMQVVRFAEALRPRWLVIENVVNMKSWARYEEFIETIEGLGYKTHTQALNAADFGVPQARRRLFILGDLKQKPSPVKIPRRKRRSASDIIDGNGTYQYSPLRTERRAAGTLARAERAIAEVGNKSAFLIVYYGTDQAGGWQRLDTPLRTITTLDRFALVKPNGAGHVMRMLQPEELKSAMGWPKKFKIKDGSRRNKVKMIGNAVCPPVMKAVISSLTKSY